MSLRVDGDRNRADGAPRRASTVNAGAPLPETGLVAARLSVGAAMPLLGAAAHRVLDRTEVLRRSAGPVPDGDRGTEMPVATAGDAAWEPLRRHAHPDRIPAAQGAAGRGGVVRRVMNQPTFDQRRNALPPGARLVLVRDQGGQLLRVDAVAPPNVTVTRLNKKTLQEFDPPQTQNGPLAAVLAQTTVYGVENHGVVTPDVLQRPYPAVGGGGMTMKTEGNLAMAFHDSSYAYGHFSYNMLDGGGGRADNEHFTVENSLSTMFGLLGEGRDTATHHEGMFAASLEDTGFWDSRQHKKKGEHQQESNRAGYAAVDNINFRPVRQRPRPLAQIPEPSMRPSEDQRKGAGTVASETVPTDDQITLERLYALARTACANLKLAGLWNQIHQSMETVRAGTGFAATDLHLNAGQRREFLKLALTMNEVAGMGLAVPAEFARFHRAGSPVVVSATTTVADKSAKGFITELRKSPANDGADWVVREGENWRNYNEISNALLTDHWGAISAWVLTL